MAVKLEDATVICEEKGLVEQKTNKISDYYITRFSTIKFYNPGQFAGTHIHKDSKDYINIEFPDFLRKDRLKIPKGNAGFKV